MMRWPIPVVVEVVLEMRWFVLCCVVVGSLEEKVSCRSGLVLLDVRFTPKSLCGGCPIDLLHATEDVGTGTSNDLLTCRLGILLGGYQIKLLQNTDDLWWAIGIGGIYIYQSAWPPEIQVRRTLTSNRPSATH